MRISKLKAVVVLGLVFAACGGSTTGDGSAKNNGGSGGSDRPEDLKPPEDLAAQPKPVATDVGQGLGDSISQTVGPAGGQVSFGEGEVTVLIPEGAMGAETMISIRPITGEAPHRRGRAFRLEPHGIHFAKPVELTFELPFEAAGTGSEQGLGVAYQDDEGFWRAVDDVRVDLDEKKIIARVEHFSDWTVFQQHEIRPVNPSVQVKKAIGLWVYRCVETPPAQTEDGFPLYLLPTCNAATGFGSWAVNGENGGNDKVGTVLPLHYGAGYTAPAKKPAANPVAVTVDFPLPKGRKGMLVSNVRVVDDGPCTFENPCSWSGTTHHVFGSIKKTSQAQVQWELAEVNEYAKQLTYRPKGSLTHRDDHENCYTPVPVRLEDQTGRDVRLIVDYKKDEPEVWLTDSVAGWDEGLVCRGSGTVGFETYFSTGNLRFTENYDIVGYEEDEEQRLSTSSFYYRN